MSSKVYGWNVFNPNSSTTSIESGICSSFFTTLERLNIPADGYGALYGGNQMYEQNLKYHFGSTCHSLLLMDFSSWVVFYEEYADEPR